MIDLTLNLSTGQDYTVIEAGKNLNPNCRRDVCAELYFYDKNDVLLHRTRGTNAWMKVRGVSKVRTVGEFGCYTIFKKTNFRGFSNLCLNFMDKLNLGEAGYPYSIVRYAFAKSI